MCNLGFVVGFAATVQKIAVKMQIIIASIFTGEAPDSWIGENNGRF
jgi:hypothetical protein